MPEGLVSMAGWIKVYRNLLKNKIWDRKPFSKGQAWIDLLLRANTEDGYADCGGTQMCIHRGELLTSARKLAGRWGWSHTKVERYMNELENETMIEQKRYTCGTLITIVKYSVYQGGTDKNDTETLQKRYSERARNVPEKVRARKRTKTERFSCQKRSTQEEPQTPETEPIRDPSNCEPDTESEQFPCQKRSRNEVQYKKKEERNNILSAHPAGDAQSLFESLWALYPNKKGKGRVSDAAKKRLQKYGFDQIKRCIERYMADQAENSWRKLQNGSTFFNSGYVDYLDENYGSPPEMEGDMPFLN